MQQDHAERVALDALVWLSADEDMMANFLLATGIEPPALAAMAGAPEVLAAVLDFVMSRDPWVLAFARSAGLPPEAVLVARQGLPGGGMVHWT